MKNKRGDIKLRALTLSTAIVMLATGFRLMSVKKEEKELLNEKETLGQECNDLMNKYDQINNTITTQNGIDYSVTDVQVINGRTVYFVTDREEEIEEEVVVEPPRYADYNSDEYIMQEDGVLHEVSIPHTSSIVKCVLLFL